VRQGSNRFHRLVVGFSDRRYETEASLWHGLDKLPFIGLAKYLSKAKNMMGQICFLDEAIGPNRRKYFLFRDNIPASFDEQQKDLDRFRR